MRCNEVRPLLDVLCDGALDAKDSALVLDHLKTCSECQSEWDSLEHLRANFRAERELTTMPDGLLDRISGALKVEERKQQPKFFIRYSFVFPVAAIAASFAVIGFVVVPQLNSVKHAPGAQLATSTTRPTGAAPEKAASVSSVSSASSRVVLASAATASAEQLVDDASVDSKVTAVDKGELHKKLGYELKYLSLPQWQLNRSAIYRGNAAAPIAKFDFSSRDKGSAGKLCCYQAPQGTIASASTKVENLGGKEVRFGVRGKYQFALWTQNERDYLFVTDLGTPELRDIIRRT